MDSMASSMSLESTHTTLALSQLICGEEGVHNSEFVVCLASQKDTREQNSSTHILQRHRDTDKHAPHGPCFQRMLQSDSA